jgi:hypothetical protein
VYLGSFGTNYIFFNPNIFEILLFTKTNFFVRENEKSFETFWNILFLKIKYSKLINSEQYTCAEAAPPPIL